MHCLRVTPNGCTGATNFSRPSWGNAHLATSRPRGASRPLITSSLGDERAAGATSSEMLTSTSTPSSAWDREHEYLHDTCEDMPQGSASGWAAQPAWASRHMEELRSHIQAMWVASGDSDWLGVIVRERAEQRSRAVRAQLAPLLPEGGTFALGELLFYDRATMLEKVKLVLGYEYGVDPQYLQPYTPVGHLVLGHGAAASSSSPLPAAASAWSVFDVERLLDTVRAALGVAPELPGAGAGEAGGDEMAEAVAAAVAEMSLHALAEAVYQALEPERSFWTYG